MSAQEKPKEKPKENPFERYDIDPSEGPLGITERFRELAEDAGSDAERDHLRAAWEELTRHPVERVRLALLAHPETRAPLPRPPLERSPEVAGEGVVDGPIDADFRDPPSVEAALMATWSRAERPPLPPLSEALSLSLEHDPLLLGSLPDQGRS